MEPAGPELMDVTRRPIGEALFTPGTIMDIFWYGIFLGALSLGVFVGMTYGFNDSEAGQATAYISLTFMLLLHAYNCRRLKHSAFSNHVWRAWMFHAALVLGAISVLFTVLVPGVNSQIFDQDNPGWPGWALSLGSCVVFMSCCEVYKVVRWLLRKVYVQMVGEYSGWKGERVKKKKLRLRQERAAKRWEEEESQKGKQKEKEKEKKKEKKEKEKEVEEMEMDEISTEEEASDNTDNTPSTAEDPTTGNKSESSSAKSDSETEQGSASEKEKEKKKKKKKKAKGKGTN